MNFSYQFFGFFSPFHFFPPSVLFLRPLPSPLRANFNIVQERRRAGSCTKIRAEFLCRTLEGFGSWKRLVERHGDISARLFERPSFSTELGDFKVVSRTFCCFFPFTFISRIVLPCARARAYTYTYTKCCARDLYISKNTKLQKVKQKCINFCY